MKSDILVIDPSIAGISGDMMLSSIVDIGADEKLVIENLESIKDYFKSCKKLEISFKDVTKNGFRAKKADIVIEEDKNSHNVDELNYNLERSIENISISNNAKAFIKNSFENLISAESALHGINKKEMHLHEAGSIDTFVDIIGTGIALDNLELFDLKEIITTPVSVGGGDITFSHGKMQNPAPAILEIARRNDIMIRGGPGMYETATPTGMAMLAALVEESQEIFPGIKPELIGIGAGSSEFKEIPNILRITLGKKSTLLTDEIAIIETNIDDRTGEELGYAMQRIIDNGALDVSLIPTIGKKGRPSNVLKVITNLSKSEFFSDLVMRETGTLGVRVYPMSRFIQMRENLKASITINNNDEEIDVKVVKSESGEIIQFKPEFDQIVKLSEKYKINLIELKDDISKQIQRELFN
ncbi:MAG: nickel pincer cofactor biosynthesis protein LarC [Nitrososphaerales archaeon]